MLSRSLLYSRQLRGTAWNQLYSRLRVLTRETGQGALRVQSRSTSQSIMAKRKRDVEMSKEPESLVKRRNSRRVSSTNPNINDEVLDGPMALRASPSATAKEEEEIGETGPAQAAGKAGKKGKAGATEKTAAAGKTGKSEKAGEVKKTGKAVEVKIEAQEDKDEDENENEEKTAGMLDEKESPEEIQAALSKPPPVNSDYLPLPWKGRLGYACLNTYLRYSNPPVFSSRTCRIASILEHRHPLTDPTAEHHATKNRPDLTKPADISRGQRYVENLGLANARDIVKMLRWNDRYGIKFFRLSSEMFPFASHAEYGYSLEPFAAETLAEAGKVAAELGHRLTTHPGQFSQLGSPRKEVITASIRDLKYHSELLSLLKLPPQQNRDAVMILHMGGMFGDKAATLDRFRENYKKLPADVKNRLVLENDDVIWTVHDLLPVCQELNIPLVLDYHHHNIMFDSRVREGTKDIMTLYDEIKATWTRKQIRQKMHYSEPTPAAITGRQRRKHSPRVATLPPCAPDMDLMIEAKDKEQAVFELMRNYRLPGWDSFNNIIPHVRTDDNKTGNGIPDDEVGMGGPDSRVYWPPTMEEWLRPAKRIVKKAEPGAVKAKKSAKSVPTPSISDHEMSDKVEVKAGRKAKAKPVVKDASDQDAEQVTKKQAKGSKGKAAPEKPKSTERRPKRESTS